MKKIILLSCILILLPLSVLAATIYVPSEQSTIQAGIDASSDGDTVLLADGTYTGVGNYNIDFNGKSITLKSASGDPDNCIVDCQGLGRGFLVYNGETVTLEGVTVKNGDAGEGNNGGGVYGNSSGITIDNCIFDSNSATSGGAVYHYRSSVFFSSCIFTSNNATNSGGAIYSVDNQYFCITSLVDRCTFTGNSAINGGAVRCETPSWFTKCKFTGNNATTFGGAIISWTDSIFTNCIFTNNEARFGGATCPRYYTSSFINCTFTLNEATEQGGATWYDIPLAQENPHTLKNCILWGNTAPEGPEIYEAEKPIIITYSNIQGGHAAGGIGNIDSGPLFVDAANDDFHLQLTSPCIDTGTAGGAPSYDLDGNFRPVGSGYDMGAYEYQGSIIIDSFTANPTTGQPSLTVDFNCQAHDDTNTITEYQWNFDDGNTETALTGTIQHTYTIPGTFTATCTVVNDNADQTTVSTSIEVTNDIPIADAGSDQIVPGNSAELDGSNSGDPDGTISSWEWTLTHIDNPAYNRSASGEIVNLAGLEFGHYTVVLTVTDNFGAQGTDEMFLCVAASDLKYTQTEYEQAQQVSHDNGYSEGHAAGVTEGYATGYSEGHSVGVTEGYATGYAEGHTAGYTEGYNAGVAAGYSTGYAEGHTAGVTEGYSSGYSVGHNVGYTEGYEAGQDDCPIHEDAEGNKFLDGPLIIENKGLLTIQ